MRTPLIHIPGGIYSAVSKCNNDEFHFDAYEKFDYYLQHLLECKRALGFRLYDICCMSNHVHEMYVVPAHVTISTILQRVKGHFSLKYNKRYNRTGHFWRNKPFYRIVQDEQYVVTSCTYYHQNPVVAGMVNDPADWPFSGYRYHVLGERSGVLGQLLDPIPGVSSVDWESPVPIRKDRVEQLLKRGHARFIGDATFVVDMQRRLRMSRAPIPTCG